MYKNKIEVYRKQKGWSLAKLAKESKISVGYLCHLEKGTRKNPSVDVMERIAQALGKAVVDVFFNSN